MLLSGLFENKQKKTKKQMKYFFPRVPQNLPSHAQKLKYISRPSKYIAYGNIKATVGMFLITKIIATVS